MSIKNKKDSDFENFDGTPALTTSDEDYSLLSL
jgi:hypothetical protein